jgi:hypothetical protein
MADIYLDVPFVSQLKFGNPHDPRTDPTGCWYASACMVGYFFEQGPRQGVPALFTERVGTFKDGSAMIGHQAIGQQTWPVLLANEHMKAISEPSDRKWKADDLAGFLRRYGPLAFRWTKTNKGSSYGHVSVMVGAFATWNKVMFHDPEDRPNTSMSLNDFNAKCRWGDPSGCLFRKEGAEFRMRSGQTIGSTAGTATTFFKGLGF